MRGTTITVDPLSGKPVRRVDPLVHARGGEVGLRAAQLDGLRSTVSVWALNLDSELLFTGDAGITEPAAASRRRGVTVANFYRPVPQLSLDADVSFAHAEFAGVEAGSACSTYWTGAPTTFSMRTRHASVAKRPMAWTTCIFIPWSRGRYAFRSIGGCEPPTFSGGRWRSCSVKCR